MTTAPPGGRDRARRAVVATAMLALFVVALGVFLLPFAFPTPPPIVTRFQATALFSPNDDGRRDGARINIRLHEPSRVTIEILKDGEPVVALLDGHRRRRAGSSARSGTARTRSAGGCPTAPTPSSCAPARATSSSTRPATSSSTPPPRARRR